MQGLLRDGITTWLPTIFGEVYGISASASVLISVILPLFGIFAVYLAGILYRSLFRNELIEAIFFFLFAGLLSLVLGFFFEANAIVSLILAALITGSLHAVNLMLIGYVPRRFARYGAVSTVSGLTNAFTYVGSAISSFGFAAVADACGWNLLIWIWGGRVRRRESAGLPLLTEDTGSNKQKKPAFFIAPHPTEANFPNR